MRYEIVISRPACACGWVEGKSLLVTGIFLWLWHNQLAFAFWRSRPIIVLGSFPPRLIPHFLADCCHLETEGWWKQGPWPPVERSIQKLIQQTFKYPCVEKSSLMVRHNMVMWCMLHWVHVSMYDVLDVCSITYQDMCIMLKIQKLHLKSGFITLKSSEGLVALVEVT